MLVALTVPWCDRCKALRPKFEEAARQLNRSANFVWVDCENPRSKAFCKSRDLEKGASLGVFFAVTGNANAVIDSATD